MDKAPDAFRTISEVADDLDVPQHVLRFWETRFRQIKPMKRGGGRRYYRPDDVDLLRGIRHLLYGEGYTIRGVQRILREQGVRSCRTSGSRARRSRSTPAEEDDVADTADELEIADVDDAESEHAETEPAEIGPRLSPSIIDREQGAPASRGPQIPRAAVAPPAIPAPAPLARGLAPETGRS